MKYTREQIQSILDYCMRFQYDPNAEDIQYPGRNKWSKEQQAAIEHSKRIVNSKGSAKDVKYPGRSMNNPFKKK